MSGYGPPQVVATGLRFPEGPVCMPELAGSNEMPAVLDATGMPAMLPDCPATDDSKALFTPSILK